MNLHVPGRVWIDALDPKTFTAEAELDLPQAQMKRRGRGVTVVYQDVTRSQARDTADYLSERALLLSAQSGLGPNERERYRIMARTAHLIKEAEREEWAFEVGA